MTADRPITSAVEVMAKSIGASSCGTESPWYWQPRYDNHSEAKMHREDDRTMATAALTALRAAGYEVVPVEPTPTMVDAAIVAWRERVRDKTARGAFGEGGPAAPLVANYRAMLSASAEGWERDGTTPERGRE